MKISWYKTNVKYKPWKNKLYRKRINNNTQVRQRILILHLSILVGLQATRPKQLKFLDWFAVCNFPRVSFSDTHTLIRKLTYKHTHNCYWKRRKITHLTSCCSYYYYYYPLLLLLFLFLLFFFYSSFFSWIFFKNIFYSNISNMLMSSSTDYVPIPNLFVISYSFFFYLRTLKVAVCLTSTN